MLIHSGVLWTYNNDRPNMGIGGIFRGPAQSGLKQPAGLFLFHSSPRHKAEYGRIRSTDERVKTGR